MKTTIPVIKYNDFNIIRGDMIQGGAKTPALLKWLPTLNTKRIVYAGSVFGSGAWAVVTAARELNITPIILMSKSKYNPPWINDISEYITWVDPQPVAQIYAMGNDIKDAINLPLGFDTPKFINILSDIASKTITTQPTEIWCAALSGTLSRALRLAFPNTILNVVTPARLTTPIDGATMYLSPEKFHQSAKQPPPYPSCAFSDAKIWQFANQNAKSDAYIWNVSL